MQQRVLLPAIVNYRVENGERIGKTNPNEAKAVVALLRACIEQPEYAGKTFGVISLLGDEQVKKLQEEIFSQIDAKVCSERRILCGNASNFQGDERDVIFLSLVDCTNGSGPIAKQGFGADDSLRKRYNVAASRAKDQLWVVHSLDSANDLKPGDIRKMLIDFSLNPESIQVMNAKIEEKSESPFEEAVAKYLSVRGYHLVQQWEVGAYRLDMVVVCGNKKIVIECDGERYHSGEDKVREDMERQTILERLGWRFIRIRGSEYFRNPEKAMERVVIALKNEGIEPENAETAQTTDGRDTELLRRVKQRAHTILHENGAPYETGLDTIAAALDTKNDVIGSAIEEVQSVKLPELPTVSKSKEIDISDAISATNSPTDEPPVCVEEQIAEIEQLPLPISAIDSPSAADILDFLNFTGVKYIDKRASGGNLWLIGGYELSDIASRAKDFGYTFRYKKEGGRATKNQPGWWAK